MEHYEHADTPITPERQALVAAASERWVESLVDLSGRNTLLYFKELQRGTLELPPLAGSVTESPVRGLLAGRSVKLSKLFRTGLEDASRRARTLRNKSRENYEERGLRTLLLGWGIATWSTSSPGPIPAAPVLLAELSLAPIGGAEEDFELSAPGEWELNPTLLHYLSSEYSLTIDADAELDQFQDDADGLFQKIASVARRSVKDFEIVDRVVVGNFSYAKLPMVVDLKIAAESGLLASHDLIAAIAGDAAARSSVRNAQVPGEVSEPDLIEPDHEFLVLDADSSQSHVISAAKRGSHLVVEGPPGTGKSQTIANLIASLTAARKRVLFVAEKRAAIDAVVERLTGVGLGDIVLDLHGGAGSRRQLATQLAETMSGHAGIKRPDFSLDQEKLSKRRSILVGHHHALHTTRSPWDISLYDAYCGVLALPASASTPLRLEADRIRLISHESLERLADHTREYSELGGLELMLGDGPLAQAFTAGVVRTPEDAELALQAISELQNRLIPAAQTNVSSIVEATRLIEPQSFADLNRALDVLESVKHLEVRTSADFLEAPLDEWHANLGSSGDSIAFRIWGTLFRRNYRQAMSAARKVLPAETSQRQTFNYLNEAREVLHEWSLRTTGTGAPSYPEQLPETRASLSELEDKITRLTTDLGMSSQVAGLEQSRSLIDGLIRDQATLFRLPRLADLHQHLLESGLGPLLESLAVEGATPERSENAVRFMWLTGVIQQISISDTVIGGFHGPQLSRVVADYQEADHAHISSAPQRVQRSVAEWAIEVRNAHPDQSDIVQRQARLKRGHLPVRELFRVAPEVLSAMKPCWVMSPLVVSQLLPPEDCFDVVIFDEASQVTPGDAIGAIMRARQVIVAGDAKQLPPTSFFDGSASASTEDDENELALTTGMESVLDVMAALLPVPHGTKSLTWHYRSRDERLINFSNAQPSLYGWSLTTFPGISSSECISHHLVPASAGVSGSANEEVERVVELILDHARTRPEESLGVIAFGLKHAERITEVLRQNRRHHPELDPWLDHGPDGRSRTEALFIKNLERVQGDERDAIILSVGYGKNEDGRMQYRFGPINNEGGERRLNVAVTRARLRMAVVASFSASEMDPTRLKSEGARMLGRYLTYAESSGTDLGHVTRDKPELNPFERDVMERLSAAGIPLVPQFGASGYWLDFVAAHPERPGEMVLAIECDGASYHSSPTARDRDRLRQEHLERLGWTFHRIWSTDWFRDPESQVRTAKQSYDLAVAASDSIRLRPAPKTDRTSGVLPPTEPPKRKGPRPNHYGEGAPIDRYSDSELVQWVRWIESDTLLRTNDEVLAALIDELGYRRRGPRIVHRLSTAIEASRATPNE